MPDSDKEKMPCTFPILLVFSCNFYIKMSFLHHHNYHQGNILHLILSELQSPMQWSHVGIIQFQICYKSQNVVATSCNHTVLALYFQKFKIFPCVSPSGKSKSPVLPVPWQLWLLGMTVRGLKSLRFTGNNRMAEW